MKMNNDFREEATMITDLLMDAVDQGLLWEVIHSTLYNLNNNMNASLAEAVEDAVGEWIK